ncbi:hypothetical protein BSF41_23940 [Flavobacterium sp. ACN2]|jgi:hypothetical protein|nr:hypothetical protein BSF41_23940 [Flavobacterium sp. ACN2]
MKNLQKFGKALSKAEMKSINGGFSCSCNGRYLGEYSSASACCSACNVSC